MSDTILLEIHEKVGRLDAKLDIFMAGHTDLIARVGKLESYKAWLTGCLAVLALPVTFAMSYVAKKFQ